MAALRVSRRGSGGRGGAPASGLLSALADDRVVRDAEQPSREGGFSPLEAFDGFQDTHEDFFRQVFGVVCIARAGKYVTVYPGEIERINLREGAGITSPRCVYYETLFTLSVAVRAHRALLPLKPPCSWLKVVAPV